jgi:hypothetical protein
VLIVLLSFAALAWLVMLRTSGADSMTSSLGPGMGQADKRAQLRRLTIQVETATWSKAGQLDRWVKERQEWWAAYAEPTAVNGGSKAVDLRPASNSQP